MGIFDRISTLVKANLNDLLEKAENPELLLNENIREMEEGVKEAKKRVLATITDLKKLELQYKQLLEKGKEYEEKAFMALRDNNEVLSRDFLSKKSRVDLDCEELHKQLGIERELVDSLKASLALLEKKVEEAKGKKRNWLKDRYKQNFRGKQPPVTPKPVDPTPFEAEQPFEDFNRMEEKVSELEAQVEAMKELHDEGFFDPQKYETETKFKELEKKSGVEDKFNELKKRLND